MTMNDETRPVLEAGMRFALLAEPVVLSVDAGIEALLGYAPGAFLAGRVTLKACIHADDQDIAEDLFAVDSVPCAGLCNIRLRQANGRIRCVKGRYRKSIEASGEVILDLLLQDAKSLARIPTEQMANFKAMMENTDDFIYFKDRNHVFTGASQTLVSITDPSEHWTDLLGQTDYDVFPEAFADIYYRLEKQVFAGIPVAHEVQGFLTNDGKAGWVDNRKYPIRDDSGELIGLFGIARDITDKKAAELALLREQEKLQLILDHAPIGIWLQDGRGKLTFVNRAFCQATGITESQFLSVPHYAELIPEPFRQQCLASDAKALASGGISVNQQQLSFADGSIHDLRVIKAVKRDENGEPQALVGLSMDITEELQQEKALRESEQRFRAIFENVDSLSVQGYDVNRRVIYWNPASERLYGYTKSQAMGRLLEELIIPESMRPSVVERIKEWAHGGASIPAGELTLRHADGSLVEVYSSHVMLRGIDGAQEMYCIDIDISERKRAEIELEKYRHHLEDRVLERTLALSIAKEAAEAANRAKSTFLANMSHELRTPMNAIMGMTELASRRAVDAKQQEQLLKVMQASRHLLGVINDILDLSKIEAERLRLEQIGFNLGGVLENLNNLLREKAEEKGLLLVLEITPELARLPLRGDPLRLGQILLNLVGNAIKFTATGSVEVQAMLMQERAGDVTLRFEVRDQGIGISTDDQKRLFTAFEQADGSTTRKYGGTGLGLAICKRLAKMMGGEVGIESKVGLGSTFWFSIRMDKDGEMSEALVSAPHNAAAAQILARFSQARVLLAEDEPINQEVSCGLLEDVGLLVDLVEDGAAAVAKSQSADYALILLDIQMPKLNGLDAARAIRALPRHRRTPILAMTANAFNEDRQECLDAGMDDHIGKPVEPGRLYKTLLHWLETVR